MTNKKLKQNEYFATVRFNDTQEVYIINDWWWKADLLVLKERDGKTKYFNRRGIDYAKLPEIQK